MQEKKYYNQKDIIHIISNATGCSIRDVTNILNSLGNVVKDKFSDTDNYVEIKIFPGLKLASKYIPLNQSGSNLADYIKSDHTLYLTANFSRRFKDSVKNLHNKAG